MRDRDVLCPACLTPCEVTRDEDNGESWSNAVCPKCDYEMDPAGVLTISDMLNGAETGPTWNDVDLPAWTRALVAMVADGYVVHRLDGSA